LFYIFSFKNKKKRESHFGPLRKEKALRFILKLVNKKGKEKKKKKKSWLGEHRHSLSRHSLT
jgi:hypothetical protein